MKGSLAFAVSTSHRLRKLSAEKCNHFGLRMSCSQVQRGLAIRVDGDTQVVVCVAVDPVFHWSRAIMTERYQKLLSRKISLL